MIKIDKLILSPNILNKLRSKNTESLTKQECQVYDAVLNGQNVAADYTISPESFVAPLLMRFEENIRTETHRNAKLVVIATSKNDCNQYELLFKSVLGKELGIYLACEIKSKKLISDSSSLVQVVIGTLNEFENLMTWRYLNVKDLKQILIHDFDKFNFGGLLRLAAYRLKNSENIQMVVSTLSYDAQLNRFMELCNSHTKKKTTGHDEYSDNHDLDKDCLDQSKTDSVSSDISKPIPIKIEVDKEETKDGNFNQHFLGKLRQISIDENYRKLTQSIIDEFGAEKAVLKLIRLHFETGLKNSTANSDNTDSPVSKLSGRSGYMAYCVYANQRIIDKGFFINCLKSMNGREIARNIDHFRFAKDFRSLAFDLPIQFDKEFQLVWQNGESISVTLFTGNVDDFIMDTGHNDRPDTTTPAENATISKYTGRKGYTGYHFLSTQVIRSKAYMLNALRRIIDLSKLENISKTKDMMGFVFDLPSQYDSVLQDHWRDGKNCQLVLLESVPELIVEPASRFQAGVETKSTISVLTARNGYTTYHFSSTVSSQTDPDYLYRSLNRWIDDSILSEIDSIERTKYTNGFVFDLPSRLDDVFLDRWRNTDVDTLTLLGTEIPELAGFGGQSSAETDRRDSRSHGDRYGDRALRGTDSYYSSKRKRENSSHNDDRFKIRKYN